MLSEGTRSQPRWRVRMADRKTVGGVAVRDIIEEYSQVAHQPLGYALELRVPKQRSTVSIRR